MQKRMMCFKNWWVPLGNGGHLLLPSICALTMLNLQLVAGEHGLFGGHESEGIRTISFSCLYQFLLWLFTICCHHFIFITLVLWTCYMKVKTVANVLEETEEYTKYKFGRLICLVHSSWLFYQIINLSIIKLSISRNTQLLLSTST